jgi:tight adherence protein C
MMGPTENPTLLGVDVLWVATILSGIAAAAVFVAIYAALSVRR